MMQCPICRSASRQVFQKHSYGIRQCENCGHRFCELEPSVEHVRTVYGDGYFTEGGAGYSDYLSEMELLVAHGTRYGRLLQRYTTPGRVLDIGAAAGFILKGLQSQGWQGIGLEPNATMAQHGQQTFGLDIRVGTLETFESSEQFKLISMVQVVAHFYELQKAFQSAAALTEPGGYWLIETWNKDSWMARLLGENWHEYSPPSVLHWFSPASLTRLASQFGFSLIARGRPEKWLKGAHAKSLVRYKLETSRLGRAGAGLLDIIPDGIRIPYPTFDLFWAIYQKQPAPQQPNLE